MTTPPLPHHAATLQAGRSLISGTTQTLIAQAMNVPLGIATAALLTRHLGPAAFGIYVAAETLVTWIEVISARTLNRTSIKLIADADDWQGVASRMMQIQLGVSLIFTLLIMLAAPLAASLMGIPALTDYLRVLAIEIPFFAMVRFHDATLLARQRFTGTAALMITHGIMRLILLYTLLQAGFSLAAAILANVGAVIAQVVVARLFTRPSLITTHPFPTAAFRSYAVPLFWFTIAISVYQNVDVVAVQILGADTIQTGYYGSAKSLMNMSGMVTAAFSPLLLSIISDLWKRGHHASAARVIREAVRLQFLLIPFLALAAGCAAEIVRFLYGERFMPAAPLVGWLIFAGLATMIHSAATSTLTAIGKPHATFTLTGPLVPLALIVHLSLIPQLGALGAALSAAITIGIGALAALWVLARQDGVRMPYLSAIRTLIAGALAYGIGAISQTLWPAEGALLIVKLLVLCGVNLLILFGLRELMIDDVKMLIDMLLHRSAPPDPAVPQAR